MSEKPSYEELLQRIRELERELQQKKYSHQAHDDAPSVSNKELIDQLSLNKTIFDTIPNPLFYKNREGRYLGCNHSFSNQILGVPSEKIIGKTLYELPDLIPKKLADIYYEQDQALLSNPGLQVYETKVRCSDKQIREFLFYKSTFSDHTGKVAGMIGLMLDVTEKNSIQYRLKESEEKYRSMMESMNDAVYICAQDLTISYMNPKMIERVGYDATGRKCHEALHDLEEPCSWCTFSRVRNGEITETEVRSPKDGNHYLVTNSPIYHQDGSTSKMTIYRDITRRIVMERELLMAKKLEAAGVFAGGIAHDYNNLMFVILGNILLLKNNFARSSPSYKLLRTAEEAARKTASLTKRLLAFTRDEPLAFEKSAIEGLLKEMIERNEEKEKYPVNLLVSDTPLSAYVDGGLIAIVLNNILKNCKDAMENGGTIFIRAARVMIDETSELVGSRVIDNPGGYICIAFTDHGSGIDERIRPHIFDPYFSTKRRGSEKGLGLGLSISYSIIKKHHGALLVETKPGAGTTVSVYLPVSDPSSLKRII